MSFIQQLDDGICKAFKNEHDVDMFVNKAYDEEKNQHLLVVVIPKDDQLNVQMIYNPILFDTEEERDTSFTNDINDDFANTFYQRVAEHIEKNRNREQ
jgi:hypothetical protein